MHLSRPVGCAPAWLASETTDCSRRLGPIAPPSPFVFPRPVAVGPPDGRHEIAFEGVRVPPVSVKPRSGRWVATLRDAETWKGHDEAAFDQRERARFFCNSGGSPNTVLFADEEGPVPAVQRGEAALSVLLHGPRTADCDGQRAEAGQESSVCSVDEASAVLEDGQEPASLPLRPTACCAL